MKTRSNKLAKSIESNLSSIKLGLVSGLCSILTFGCSDVGSLGPVEPITPLIEARYQADAAARTIHDQFEQTDPEYAVGQLLYNDAYTSINALIQQIITTLQANSELPTVDESDAESSSSNNGEVKDFQKRIEKAISDSRRFNDFVKREICSKGDAYSELCIQTQILEQNLEFLNLFPVADLAKKLFDAIKENLEKAQELREARRKELITQYKSLLLLPFNEIIALPEESVDQTVSNEDS